MLAARMPTVSPLWHLVAMGLLTVAAAGPVAGVPGAALGLAHAVLLLAPKDFVGGGIRAACVAGCAAAAAAVGGWLLLGWLCIIIGLLTGRLLACPGPMLRSAAVIELLLVFTLAFFCVLPESLVIEAVVPSFQVRLILVGGLLAGTALLTVAGLRSAPPSAVDPVIVLLVTLLTLVLALVAALLVSQQVFPYTVAVLAVVILGEALALGAWLLWSPKLGSGLSTAFFRHVVAQGEPLALWMENLEQIYLRTEKPEAFWQATLGSLLVAKDLLGIDWTDLAGQNSLVGARTKHRTEIQLPGGRIEVYGKRQLLPARVLSLWLLLRVASEFHLAKQRELNRSQDAMIRSIHEIGARTTHDIKNLLHIIRLLCNSDATGANWERRRTQLAELAGRLEDGLGKLGAKSARAAGRTRQPAAQWWGSVQRRYAHAEVVFVEPELPMTDFGEVPVELFDRALENLLHNALRKRLSDPAIAITVAIAAGPELSVTDTGAAVAAAKAAQIFTSPMPSAEGMGIGLFQLATESARDAMRLRLVDNSDGCVRFVLAPARS